MRCKKHFSDISSTIGVCASCLRERLFSVIAAHALARSRDRGSAYQDNPVAAHPPDPPPPLIVPRFISPYITWGGNNHNSRFYHTPQAQKVDPMARDMFLTWAGGSKHGRRRRKLSFLQHFLIFRSRFDRVDFENGNDRVSSSFDQDSPESSPSLFSLLKGRRKNVRPPRPGNNTCYTDNESSHRGGGGSNSMKVRATPDRGFPSGSDVECYFSERATPASTGRMRNQRGYSSEVVGMRFCLSPLVRASHAVRWRHPLEEGTCSVDVRLPRSPGKGANYNNNRKLDG